MKKLFVLIAACAAMSSCSDLESARKHREALKFKKVRAKVMSCYANKCIVGRTTIILNVDTMYHINDTISQGNYMYVITK
jgi:murein endopeptidase